MINLDVLIFGKVRFYRDVWKSLVVGDFVCIYNDDEFLVDIIIFVILDFDGVCYVEIKNLDGEINLKVWFVF